MMRTVLTMLVGMMTVSANAQFGSITKSAKNKLGGVTKKVTDAPGDAVNKASKKVTDKANDTMDDAKKKAEKKAKDKIEGAKNEALYNRTWKPSKKAKAADPQASNSTVLEGYTRPVMNVHAGYEHLPSVYLSPYYDNGWWYYMDTDQNSQFHKNMRKSFYKAAFKFLDQSKIGYIYANGGESGDMVPRGYMTLWANMARFAADLKGEVPVRGFIDALTMLDRFTFGGVSIGPNTSSKEIDSEHYLIDTPANMLKVTGEEAERLTELLYTVTPFEVLMTVADKLIDETEASRASDPINAATCYEMAEMAMNKLAEHPGNPKDDAYEQFTRKWNALTKARREIMSEAKTESYGLQDMPKTLKKDAKFTQMVLGLAKKNFADKNIHKVVFFSDDWAIAKEAEWPYRITLRTQVVGILYKRGDDWMLERWDFVQPRSGNTWGKKYYFQLPMGNTGARKVRYDGK
ncbi:MAG: hypothetical protein J6W24_08415 [Prevotella sp.]|nr:hypothetical protein [Prevotella sp.]